ncbi:hypothetical protein C8A01DRAFT_39012 [Parachaetomium inaequale]|uniref:Uncharacterized protein n=1 Tax=Parachaetomium inaequale TaxID=2588326 RepID=A0AAN6PA19_9PEZI|nr:hypothetical protein C8A01DRAFT_39012 [Parachaetomium inaequale]
MPNYVQAHYSEKEAWYESLPALLEHQQSLGYLELVEPPAHKAATAAAPTEYITTPRGALLSRVVYDDIRLATEHFPVPPDIQTLLSARVTVRTTRDTAPLSLRSRLGARWAAPHREHLLSSKSPTNPFRASSNVKLLGRFRLATGLLRKSRLAAAASGGLGADLDLFIPRLLPLAQLCGVEAVNLSDLAELAAHAHLYEKLARGYLALRLGVDVSRVTNLALLGGGVWLGSTQNVYRGFGEAAPRWTGRWVVVGTVGRDGKVVITYPKPGGELVGVEWEVDDKAAAREGGQILMLDGWAVAVGMRPGHLEGQGVVQRDVHGSPLYGSDEAAEVVVVRVKRGSDGRLLAKPKPYGILTPPKVNGQGVFGRRCGCTTAVPAKRIDARTRAVVSGVQVDNFAALAENRLLFHNLYLVWRNSDVVKLVGWADAYVHSTYVQVFGECLHCAVTKALGTGCTFIIAGGGPPYSRHSYTC